MDMTHLFRLALKQTDSFTEIFKIKALSLIIEQGKQLNDDQLTYLASIANRNGEKVRLTKKG